MDVAAAIAHALARAGVRRTFGLLGSGNLRIVHSLVNEHRIPFHNARHENGAVGMADGWARATGEPGVCLVTQGPALTNTFTALLTAARGRAPLLLIAGDSSGVPGAARPFAVVQALDQVQALDGVGITSKQLEPQRAVPEVLASLAEAQRRQRPMVLHFPVQHESTSYRGPRDHDTSGASASSQPTPAALDAAAKLLAGAERPLFVAGLGAVRSRAGPAIRALADRTGAVLGTTLRACGLFADDRRSVGVVGGFSLPPVLGLVRQADVVVGFGASLNHFTTKRGQLLGSGQRLVHVDLDSSAFGRHSEVDTALLGDARTVANELLGRLDGSRDPWADPASALAGYDLLEDLLRKRRDVTAHGALDPRLLCARLDQLLPEQRVVVTDGGHFCMFVIDHVRIPDPSSLLWMVDFGATGGGLGPAFGAAVGRPDDRVVLFIGDGGFLMSLGDLDVAVRDRIPVVVIVMNDRAYGAEVHQLQRAGLDNRQAIFDTPDLAVVARSLGADALTVASLDDLDLLPARLQSHDGPLVVDCQTSREVVARVVTSL